MLRRRVSRSIKPERLLLGPNQPFPQTCFDCEEPFVRDEPITMLPWLCEGDILCVGRLPRLHGEFQMDNYGGRVLWAAWLCAACALVVRGPSNDIEPILARRERLYAERRMNRAASATGRQRVVQRARAQRYR